VLYPRYVLTPGSIASILNFWHEKPALRHPDHHLQALPASTTSQRAKACRSVMVHDFARLCASATASGADQAWTIAIYFPGKCRSFLGAAMAALRIVGR